MLKSLVSVDRALMRASNVETNKLEKHMTFLATTAAVTPFIGLFGTVLGIIVGVSGHRRAGIDEPRRRRARHRRSVDRHGRGPVRRHSGGVFLQLTSQRVKGLASEMDDFSLEFLNIVERNFT